MYLSEAHRFFDGILLETASLLSCYGRLYFIESFRPCDCIVLATVSVIVSLSYVCVYGDHGDERRGAENYCLLFSKCRLLECICTCVSWTGCFHFHFDQRLFCRLRIPFNFFRYGWRLVVDLGEPSSLCSCLDGRCASKASDTLSIETVLSSPLTLIVIVCPCTLMTW